MAEFKIHKFPKTRIATIDVCDIGKQKHHIVAMIEIDVSTSREKIERYKKGNHKISFTAWLIKAISLTVKDYELVASYLKGKREAIIFNDINISILVEKELNGQKVPIPLIIEKVNERTLESITTQIRDARDKELTEKDIVLQKKSRKLERIYYVLPGFIRRFFWRYLLKNPVLAFNKMGNVAITSIGMMGNVNGWFIPISVHPICIGISSVTKKPIVVNDKIEIREILNMTILLDHDVIDGAPMARFISDLSANLEKGIAL
jgi:pyruvate/2-oxoglutarate dehydrogenase complex dihydrolipoamide acyltransferase (E2) component